MIIAVNDHQGKAKMLTNALYARGHTIVDRDYVPAHALLIDLDVPVSFYEQCVEKQVQAGATVMLYQHGAFPVLVWDGLHPASDRVTAYLVQNEGTRQVGEMYNLPHKQHVIGWHYCPMLPYIEPTEFPKRILFAPWHPLQSGFVHPDRQRKNAQMFEELLKLDGVQLIVRMIGSDVMNGIPQDEPGVEYIFARPDNSYADIDAADLVVSPVGTFPLLALARGKPTVMYGMDLRPHDGDRETNVKYVHTWPKYREYMHYPYHWPDRGLAELIEMTRICPAWYIHTFVGDPLDGEKFVDLFENIVEGEHAYA